METTTTKAEQISRFTFAFSLTFTMGLQGFFAFFFLRDLSLHSYGWAFVELVFLGIWTWLLKNKLDKWRTPE